MVVWREDRGVTTLVDAGRQPHCLEKNSAHPKLRVAGWRFPKSRRLKKPGMESMKPPDSSEVRGCPTQVQEECIERLHVDNAELSRK